LDLWERELAEIEERAATQVDDARNIVRAIETAIDDTVAIPVYGSARRVRHRAVAILEDPDHPFFDDPDERLVLPVHEEWVVDDVEPWAPPARDARAARESAAESGRAAGSARKAKLVVLCIVLALVASFVLGVVARLR
jgi:hypothetical protein